MKFLDLFAGIGGFRLGMEKAGHECVGFVECDPLCTKCKKVTKHIPSDERNHTICTVCGKKKRQHARFSYENIHNTQGEWTAYDITSITDDDLGLLRGKGIEVICGGFPCQSFSIAGKRGGFSDTRGTMFFEIARIAKQIKPRILFLENVKGLLSHEEGKTYATILNTLDELGYDAEWQVLNSKNYGVPQNRDRVFIVGHLRGSSGREVFPIPNNSQKTNELQRQQGISNTLTARYAAKSQGSYVIEREQHAQTIRIKENVKKGYTEAVIGDGIRLDHIGGTTGRGRIQKGISPTLTTSCMSGVILPEYKIRQFTPRECFRLQGFPDWAYEKAAEVNRDSQLYKQAGNSVTVNVIYEIAKRLDKGEKTNEQP